MRRSILVFAAVAAVGVAAASAPPPPGLLRQLALFGDVYDIVQRQYVEQRSDEVMMGGAMKGLLASLDPHSQYLTPEEFDAIRNPRPTAAFGLALSNDAGRVKIINTLHGSPAEISAIKPGDYLVAVDGVPVSGADLEGATKRTRGAPGTSATLWIEHPTGGAAEVTLTRAFIQPSPVEAHAAGDYGIIRIDSFNHDTIRETAEAVEKLKHDLPGMKGVVLDLRNNPGGLLDACVNVASDFLNGGEIVTQRERNPSNMERYSARPNGDLLNGLPMVVLVNQSTASGAEIVTGALKDRGRAVVVGLTTYGIGSVQTVIPLHGGQDGALKLTTSRTFTPSGRPFQRVGIEPDLEVASTREEAVRLASRQFQVNEDAISNALSAGDGRTRRPPHAILDFPPNGFDTAKGDYQLERALDVLRAGGDVGKVRKPAGLAVG